MLCVINCVNAFEIRLTSKTVGVVRLVSMQPGEWSIHATINENDGKEVVHITLNASAAIQPPRFQVEMDVPQIDIHHLWNCKSTSDRCWLKPDWLGPNSSQLACGMPLYAFINDNNQNRLTIACSESLRRVDALMGMHEEDAMITARLSFFNAPEAPLSHYEVDILLDGSNRFWGEAISEGAQWISASAGLSPCQVPNAAYEPLYSSWYQFHQNIKAEDIEAECKMASLMGMKTIILDDGWQTDDNNRGYAYCGDWEVSKNRFPDIKRHVEQVQHMGMKYMMWYSVPYVGHNSKAYKLFKGKYLWDSDQQKLAALDPRFPEVRQYLCKTYQDAITTMGLDGFKLDFIDVFKLDGEDPAEKEDYAGRDIKSLPEAVNALMSEIYYQLHEINPDVLIEFRQEYVGPAIRQYGNMLRAADCPGDMQGNRIRICNLRLTSGNTAVHSDMLEWNVNETPENAARTILSALFSTIQYSMMLRDIPESHRQLIRHWIAFTNEHRKTLLQSEFRPYHPEQCFPMIEAESDTEKIVAIYSPLQVYIADGKPTIVVNASRQRALAVDGDKGKYRVECFDCLGNKTDSYKIKITDKAFINIPVSGYCKIQKL